MSNREIDQDIKEYLEKKDELNYKYARLVRLICVLQLTYEDLKCVATLTGTGINLRVLNPKIEQQYATRYMDRKYIVKYYFECELAIRELFTQAANPEKYY